jgi:hypothetical protein
METLRAIFRKIFCCFDTTTEDSSIYTFASPSSSYTGSLRFGTPLGNPPHGSFTPRGYASLPTPSCKIGRYPNTKSVRSFDEYQYKPQNMPSFIRNTGSPQPLGRAHIRDVVFGDSNVSGGSVYQTARGSSFGGSVNGPEPEYRVFI